MANRIEITASAGQAIATIDKVKGSLDKIANAATSLQGTLSALFLGATILNAIKLADSVDELSKSSNIAIQTILGFNAALIDNGGDAEKASAAITKLVQTIGDAAGGSLQAQNAFARVGISLNDLRTLSEEDILKRTVQALGTITDKTKQAALANDIYGKSLRNADWNGLASDIERATAAQAANVAATKAAADLQGNLDSAVRKLNESILKSIQPLADFVNGLKPDQVDKFVNGVVDIAKALALLAGAATVLSWIGGAFATLFATSAKGLALMKAGFVGVGAVVRAFAVPIGEGIGWLIRFALAMSNIGTAAAPTIGGFATLTRILAALLIPLGAIAAGFGTILAVVLTVTSALYLAAKASDTFFDTKIIDWFVEKAVKARDAIKGISEYMGLTKKEVPNQGRGGQGGPTAEELAAWDKLQKAKKAAEDKPSANREVVDAMAKRRFEIQQTSKAFQDFLDTQNAGLYQEASFVGMQEDQVELFKAQIDVLNKAEEEIKKLQTAKSLLSKDEQGLAGVYDAQIKKIRELTIAGLDETAAAVTNNQTVKAIEKDRLQNMENMQKAIEDQISRQQQLGEILRGINDQKVDLKFEQSLKGLTPLQKEIVKIQETARKAALEAGRSFSAAFDSEDGLTPERAEELANGLNQIAQGYRDIAQAQIDAVNNVNPLMDAWEEYKTNALDATSQIRNSFDNFTNGLEDSIVKFVQTGKLSFKDLAQSVIADLARIAAKRAIVAIGTSLFGFANGGDVMSKTPIIVGERGPELFIPQSAGSIVSNATLKGSGSSGDYGGGQTVVNYNIQAVDASSFRSLVARDPSFIYAVTEQGRRSQPTRRGF